MASAENKKPAIFYSCYFARSREGEQFVSEHVFSYQASGSLITNDGKKVYLFEEGDFRFSRRNRFSKFEKRPPEGGEFKSLSVYLDQGTLMELSKEMGYEASEESPVRESVISLPAHPLYRSFMDSLLVYLTLPEAQKQELLHLKIKEAIRLLLTVNPELKDILFHFKEPGKIDLEAFMEKNFQFDVRLDRFAYLTGRSLSTFKRDFEKIFHSTPNRWLRQRRLQEAHYLLKVKRKKPSEVYLEVGFNDYSHFSFAFKKVFGRSPSQISLIGA